MSLDISNPANLADVREALNNIKNLRNRRHLISSIDRIAEFLHRAPQDISTDVPSLRKQINTLHPVQCGVQTKTLSNVKSNLQQAFREVELLPTKKRPPKRDAVWEEFLTKATAEHQVYGVSRFVDFCAAQGLHPDEVDTDVLAAFKIHLDTRMLFGNLDKKIKATTGTWNLLARRQKPPFLKIEGGPRKQFRARPLTIYPASLQKDLQAYLDRLTHADIFASDAPDKALRPTTLSNIRAHIRQVLDALVDFGHEQDEFVSLAEVVVPARVETALRAILKRRGDGGKAGVGNIAATMLAIAKHHCKSPEDQLLRLRVFGKKLSQNPSGMSEKNTDRLRQFDDWANIARIVSLSSELMERADKAPNSRESALLAMHAASLEILLGCPMRVKNLSSIDLERHIQPLRNGSHTIYSIFINEREVKNSQAIEFRLNNRASRVLHRYIKQYRNQLTDVASTALFPRRNNGEPRDPAPFGSDLKALIYRETGITMHAHLFRHFAAFLYLKKKPGEFETVRRLLGHKRPRLRWIFMPAFPTNGRMSTMILSFSPNLEAVMTNLIPLVLKFEHWPRADKAAWDALFTEGDIFSDAGPSSRWSEGTRTLRRQSHRRRAMPDLDR